LQDNTRRTLCKIIGTHILKNDPEKSVLAEQYLTWQNQIKTLFPKEAPSAYFCRALRDSTKGMVWRVQGKLPDMVHNLRKKYREANIIKRKSYSPSETSLNNVGKKHCGTGRRPSCTLTETTPIQNEDILWLQNSSDPWRTVLEKWGTTRNDRLKEILSNDGPTIQETLKKYPALSKPNGYVLVSTHFLFYQIIIRAYCYFIHTYRVFGNDSAKL